MERGSSLKQTVRKEKWSDHEEEGIAKVDLEAADKNVRLSKKDEERCPRIRLLIKTLAEGLLEKLRYLRQDSLHQNKSSSFTGEIELVCVK